MKQEQGWVRSYLLTRYAADRIRLPTNFENITIGVERPPQKRHCPPPNCEAVTMEREPGPLVWYSVNESTLSNHLSVTGT